MLYSRAVSIFYFLLLLIFVAQVMDKYCVNANLFSEFNNELDRMSNYAENRVRQKTFFPLEKIYEHNGQLLRKHLRRAFRVDKKNANKLRRVNEIEKLMNVLSSLHDGSMTLAKESRMGDIAGEQQNNDRNSRSNYFGQEALGLNTQNYISPQTELVGVGEIFHYDNKWPLKKLSLNGITNSSPLKKGLHLEKNRSKRKVKKRYNTNLQLLDPRNLMSSSMTSMYPNVMARSPEFNTLSLASLPKTDNSLMVGNIGLPNNDKLRDLQSMVFPLVGSQNLYSQLSQPLQSSQQLQVHAQQQLQPKIQSQQAGESQNLQYDNSAAAEGLIARQSADTVGIESNCPENTEAKNLTSILEHVLQELRIIAECKSGNIAPDGTPCSLFGAWNSEVVGMRFDISEIKERKGLDIGLRERYPSKRNTLMDSTWACSGGAIKTMGGPFYISAEKQQENILATFAGLCKICGNVDTIFGTWTFIRPAKDCHDMQTTIETKRDVFRRDLLEQKKKLRLEQLQISSTTPNVILDN